MKLSVESMQVGSLGYMSIIGRNVTDDFPGWSDTL